MNICTFMSVRLWVYAYEYLYAYECTFMTSKVQNLYAYDGKVYVYGTNVYIQICTFMTKKCTFMTQMCTVMCAKKCTFMRGKSVRLCEKKCTFMNLRYNHTVFQNTKPRTNTEPTCVQITKNHVNYRYGNVCTVRRYHFFKFWRWIYFLEKGLKNESKMWISLRIFFQKGPKRR